MNGDAATRDLREEHELILDYVELISELAGSEAASFERSPLAAHHPALSEFLAAFADRFHHAKEEDLLFARLRPHLRHCNPVEQMLYEHELLRELRSAMDEAHRQRDLGALVEASESLCRVLAEHVFKEDHILYPLAERALSDVEQAALRRGYAEASARADGPALRARFEALRDVMRAELGAEAQVPRSASPAAR